MKTSSANAVWSADPRDSAPRTGQLPGTPLSPAVPHGAAVVVSVRSALENGDRSRLLVERLLAAAKAAPLCLHPVDLPGGEAGLADWRSFCGWLQHASIREQVNFGGLATCVHSHHLPLAEFHTITDTFFGAGQRFVLLDGLQLQTHHNERVAATAAANWTYLWRERESQRPVLPVYGGFVRSICPLLADEAAVTVLPETGLQVPAHSAWLPVHLDLLSIADGNGRVDSANLRQATFEAVSRADHLIDCSRWPGRRRQADSRLNRRIAISVTGIGDLVMRRGDDPGSLDCLKAMQDQVGEIRAELHAVTVQLARQFGEVPSLSRACPPRNWFAGPHKQAWQARFDNARLNATVRNRNLLALSPYAVLPASDRPTPRFMDLLPLLGLADVWAFAGAPRLAGWNVTQFKYFHMRARAIIQASQIASRVAAGV